ncbi:hypothetical protein WDH52_17570 [Streptomyces sp. TRM70308]|uniref:hypothetical protein n=1 Tax=Streptomyces sp. TRM70308 TaxID=3131932 RepID=UPI003D058026
MNLRADTAHWLGALRRQFPELLDELAPGGSSPGLPRAVPGPASPSRTTAPLRLHVSDAVRDITDGVTELEEAVRDRLRLGRARRATVPQRVARVLALLDQIQEHPVLAEHVRDEARRMARRCARVLGESEPMTALATRCPWCGSVSLRAFPERGAVLCINPACRCDEADCDCRTDPAHRHAWPDGGLPDAGEAR